MNLPSILKDRREILGISQNDLAEISGVSLATVKDIERGKSNPTIKTMEKIADTLGLEVKLKLKELD